jgi:hypothetical protein
MMTENYAVERAERASRGRAAIMTLAAAVLLINGIIDFGHPAYSQPGWRGVAWPFVDLAWLVILTTGGGLRANRRLRELMNDELSLHNRGRALAVGFYATILAAVATYFASWRIPMTPGDALQLVTALGLATALLCYAWLEWR